MLYKCDLLVDFLATVESPSLEYRDVEVEQKIGVAVNMKLYSFVLQSFVEVWDNLSDLRQERSVAYNLGFKRVSFMK